MDHGVTGNKKKKESHKKGRKRGLYDVVINRHRGRRKLSFFSTFWFTILHSTTKGNSVYSTSHPKNVHKIEAYKNRDLTCLARCIWHARAHGYWTSRKLIFALKFGHFFPLYLADICIKNGPVVQFIPSNFSTNQDEASNHFGHWPFIRVLSSRRHFFLDYCTIYEPINNCSPKEIKKQWPPANYSSDNKVYPANQPVSLYCLSSL